KRQWPEGGFGIGRMPAYHFRVTTHLPVAILLRKTEILVQFLKGVEHFIGTFRIIRSYQRLQAVQGAPQVWAELASLFIAFFLKVRRFQRGITQVVPCMRIMWIDAGYLGKVLFGLLDFVLIFEDDPQTKMSMRVVAVLFQDLFEKAGCTVEIRIFDRR